MSKFKGTKGKIHAVEYAGFINMQDGEFYGDKNILDYEHVGEEVAIANGKLFECAPEMLEELKQAVKVLKTVYSFGATTKIIERWELLIKKATE